MGKRIPTILIIEDDLDTRDMLSRLLTSEGYAVRIAANGWEGLLAAENPVDLILLDMMLPGMDGYSFLTSLRGQKRSADLPVVVVTALDVTTVAAKVRPLGVMEIIPKGTNLLPQLRRVLQKVLAKPRPQARVDLAEKGNLVRPYLEMYLRTLEWG